MLCFNKNALAMLLDADFRPLENTLPIAIANYWKVGVYLLLEAGATLSNVTHVPVLWDMARFKAAGFRQEEENSSFDRPLEVHPLQDICRNAVRRHLKTDRNFIVQIEKLPLPKLMKKFLLFEENEPEPENSPQNVNDKKTGKLIPEKSTLKVHDLNITKAPKFSKEEKDMWLTCCKIA